MNGIRACSHYFQKLSSIHLCRLGFFWTLVKKKRSTVCICLCEWDRGGGQWGGVRSKEHRSVCALMRGWREGLLYLNIARLLTLFIAIPPLQRPTTGYYHLACVNTSYAAELWTCRVSDCCMPQLWPPAERETFPACALGVYWFAESFSNLSRDSYELSGPGTYAATRACRHTRASPYCNLTFGAVLCSDICACSVTVGSHFPSNTVMFPLSDHWLSLNAAHDLFLAESQIHSPLSHAGFSHTTVRQDPQANAPIAEWQGPQSMSNQMSKEQLGDSKLSHTFISPIFLSAAGIKCMWQNICMGHR